MRKSHLPRHKLFKKALISSTDSRALNLHFSMKRIEYSSPVFGGANLPSIEKTHFVIKLDHKPILNILIFKWKPKTKMGKSILILKSIALTSIKSSISLRFTSHSQSCRVAGSVPEEPAALKCGAVLIFLL
ncbi:hypothetical protein VNO78_34394 [Psophocarpus tetragonolobus]|uniref:Uncharacterized protein n=1 Tax=Psophocarpus tetragonolobus TaxID=3891 RepID=A0AAN9NW59_PSOTE